MTRRVVLAVLIALTVAWTVSAQVQTGSISGTVTDQQGAVITGATVTVVDEATNVTYTAKTNDEGAFIVAGLPFGTYRVVVELKGFKKWEGKGVRVVTAQEAVLHARLEVGSIDETITVEAGQEVMSTTSAQLNTDINRRQIVDLPLVTRNPVNLVTLQAGVQVTTGTRDAVIGGLRGAHNNITQDGINVQDNFIRDDGLFVQASPTVENTGEFSITTQNVGADAGFGVAQVRITTPRGQNEFHGSLFYFHRNDALNANSFTNNLANAAIDREREHRYGLGVGGPVYIPKLYDGREKTFFFVRYEAFRENQTVTQNRTVMSQEARQGLFRYRAACGASGQPACPSGITSGQLITVNLLTASSNFTNTTSAGRPITSLNPFTTRFINATPLPNNTKVGDGLNTGGFEFALPSRIPNDNYTLRFDHKLIENFGGTHWLEVSWNRQDNTFSEDTINGAQRIWIPEVVNECIDGMCIGRGQFPRRRTMAVALHSTISPTMFNEARFGFFRPFSAFTRQAAFPRDFRVDFPTITDPEQNALSAGRFTPTYTFIDNFSKVWRAHTFKMGATFNSVSSRPFSSAGTIPTVALGTNSTNVDGLQISSFPALAGGSGGSQFSAARGIYQGLVGLVGSVSQTFNAYVGQGFVPGVDDVNKFRERYHALYFQDQWRMRSNLTLTLGLRYELVYPTQELLNRTMQPVNFGDDLFISGSLFSPQSTPTYADVKNSVVQTLLTASGRDDRKYWSLDSNNLAPSIGIAWTPTSRTVIRTGFSISYAREGLNVTNNASTSSGGFSTTVTQNLLCVNPNPVCVIDPNNIPGLTPPPFGETVDQLTNAIATSAGAGLFTFDRNLRTPYVMQWSFGIQRELSSTTAVEIRYAGNRGLKLIRGIDLSQIDVFSNGMAQEFAIAQANLAICRANRSSCPTDNYSNRGLLGQMALPILTAMGVPSTQFTSSTRIGNLDRNELGEWVHQLVVDCTNRFLRSTGCAGMGTFPANFFRVHPLALFADLVGNNSQSTYDALQIEFRRRISNGLLVQANYTWGKAITDFSGTSSEFSAIIDLNQRRYERTPSDFNVAHTFNLNAVWEVPVGEGRRWASGDVPVLSHVISNWQMGTIWQWRSGRPVLFTSGRGTINRNARSGRNAAVLVNGWTPAQVCSFVGVHKTSNGVFLLPEEFFVRGAGTNTTGGNPAIFGHPGAGVLGDHRLLTSCTGPGYINFDMNLIKRIPIWESVNFEFRAEFFNLFNHANFLGGLTQGVSSAGFASLNSGGNDFGGREIQFNFRINW